MASSSALDDTEEKCNGTKLARLLIDGGTETVRRSFDAIHPPANLQVVLHTNKPQLNTLRGRKVLNQCQWDKLYPPGGAAPDSKTFDITVLFVLLRNICSLTAPSTGWDALPHAADVSQEANLARIKFYRNHVYGHVTGTGVSNADFEQYWNDISGALIALGANQVDIDLLKSSAVGETNYMALLTKWKLEEVELKEMLKEGFCDLKAEVRKHNTPKQTSMIESLTKCDFSLHTSSLVDQFQKGTRWWILNKIDDFYTNQEQPSRALVITALPGVGKSVLAAVACRNAREKGRLGACHFVQHNDSQRSNPRVVIESIARHLCDTIEGFKEKLHSQLLPLQPDIRKKLDEMNLNALFSVLIEEPLAVMQSLPTEQSVVVVIDALDEIEPSSRKEFIIVLLGKLKTLPKGIKFILTSRPLEQLTDLPHVTVVNIEATGSCNTKDIKLYLSEQLQLICHDESSALCEASAAKLTERSRGFFLYAHFVLETAKKKTLQLSELSNLFPNGISSVYEEYLTRAQTELHLDEEKFISFLKGIIAAQAPLPQSLVLEILCLNRETQQEKKVARKALNSLSLLFPKERNHISIFHKSLADWLTTTEDEEISHDFSVKVVDGHRVIAEHCLKVLRAVKSHKSFPPELSDSENYALTFGFHHMLEAGGYEEQLGECVQDLELLAAMWVARGKTTPNVLSRRYDMAKELQRVSDSDSLLVEDLSHLHQAMNIAHVPIDCPQFVLQCAAFCPSSFVLNSKATRLFNSHKYRNCTWVDKQEIYSIREPLYIESFSCGEHTVACICVHGREQLKLASWESRRSCTLMTVSIESGEQLAKVDLGDSKNKSLIQVSPSDKHVVHGEHFGRELLHLRDVRTLHVQRTFVVNKSLSSWCFVPGNKLVAGCLNGTVHVWDMESGDFETTFQCSRGPPVYCTASSAGQILIVELGGSGEPDSALLWRSIRSPEPVQLASDIHLDHLVYGGPPSFSPDGRLVACACVYSNMYGESHIRCREIKVFCVATAQLLNSLLINRLYSRLVFINDNNLLLQSHFQMVVMSINDGSSQELAVESLFVANKGPRECVAVDGDYFSNCDRRTLYKLSIHNLS